MEALEVPGSPGSPTFLGTDSANRLVPMHWHALTCTDGLFSISWGFGGCGGRTGGCRRRFCPWEYALGVAWNISRKYRKLLNVLESPLFSGFSVLPIHGCEHTLYMGPRPMDPFHFSPPSLSTAGRFPLPSLCPPTFTLSDHTTTQFNRLLLSLAASSPRPPPLPFLLS
jgi:hypothetical protein